MAELGDSGADTACGQLLYKHRRKSRCAHGQPDSREILYFSLCDTRPCYELLWISGILLGKQCSLLCRVASPRDGPCADGFNSFLNLPLEFS